MNPLFNIEQFISEKITGRRTSLLKNDLENFHELISERVGGKSVLVIGAAGTIGCSFVKALLPYRPARLVVVDINENGLTELVRDCRSRHDISLPKDFKSYPVNFGDRVFGRIFQQNVPFDIVANFAAHKHVRSEKDVYSIEAMIDNNVLKAKKLLDLLLRYPPKHFFCVSTDKAANPVNIMGATKKLMEEVILAYSDNIPVTTARFANVAFSNGSLLAGFLERMMKQQPLSCPSDVKRFFLAPSESGEICLLACILGKSGEIFFPKLDSEKDIVNISCIVPSFLEKLGYEPDICSTEQEAREKAARFSGKRYPVYFFTSDTSGEKLFEEFYTGNEEVDLDQFHSLGIIRNAVRRNRADLEPLVERIEGFFQSDFGKTDVINLLRDLLPDFRHIETGLSLDQKM